MLIDINIVIEIRGRYTNNYISPKTYTDFTRNGHKHQYADVNHVKI